MLGTPDAMSVASDFGVYAADHVQKIQVVFLAQCSDEQQWPWRYGAFGVDGSKWGREAVVRAGTVAWADFAGDCARDIIIGQFPCYVCEFATFSSTSPRRKISEITDLLIY